MTVETLDDYERGKVGVVRRWLEELEMAGKWQEPWEERAKRVIQRYNGEEKSSFNILHSNIETLRPNIFAQRPEPDVRRRVNQPDPTSREAAELLERGVRYMNDTAPYEAEVNAAVNDYLLAGRAVLRNRYTPTVVRRSEPAFEAEEGFYISEGGNLVDAEDVQLNEDGSATLQLEEVVFERSDIEHIPYDDFRHHPAKIWRDVRWVAFRHYFNREGLDNAFGKTISSKTELTVEEGNQTTKKDTQVNPDIYRRAEVWEIWDKETRKILFISPGNIETPLLEADDPYDLENFFPTPEPLRSICTPGTLLPTPEFAIYQDLADELDSVTKRITEIVETIDVRGAYNGAMPELASILNSPVKLIAVDGWSALSDKGGLAAMLDFIPIEANVKAFVALVEQRDQLIQTIYQTIGLSDISRGSSDPRETATAQRLKGQFGNMRLAPRQREWQKYLRDLMRMQAEIMAEKFEPTTLTIMTGIQVDENILMLLRNDALRNFSIDIETDSTIAADQAAQMGELKEMLEGLAGMGQALQALPEGARLPFMQSTIRKMHLGRDVEIAIEEAAQQPPTPDPEAIAAQQEAQIKQADLQQRAKESDEDFAIRVEELKLKQRDQALKESKAEADVIQGMF